MADPITLFIAASAASYIAGKTVLASRRDVSRQERRDTKKIVYLENLIFFAKSALMKAEKGASPELSEILLAVSSYHDIQRGGSDISPAVADCALRLSTCATSAHQSLFVDKDAEAYSRSIAEMEGQLDLLISSIRSTNELLLLKGGSG